MESNPPLPDSSDQRLLAAIVFTDVAGFTARVQEDETAALKLLERDFARMREFAAELSGTVLKTTGDGLLLYFVSAVQAVSWALKTQRHFAAQSRAQSRTDSLRHRVGVHVGDVFMKAHDVMGDGVNIAARVQAEAPPGGVCISQTVYDVVKNKMELHVIRLEPRRLKNIREHIQMYHLLLETPAPVASAPAAPTVTPKTARPATPPQRRITGLVLLLVAIAAAMALVAKKYFEGEKDLAASRATHAALGSLLAEKKTPTSDQPADPTPATAVADEIDFARLALDRAGSATATRDPVVQRKAAEALAAVNAWILPELERYSRDRVLTVRPLRGTAAERSVYLDAEKRVCLAQAGIIRQSSWAGLKPDEQGAIILSALRSRSTPTDPAVVRGAEAFAFIHALPEMADALMRERLGRSAR